MENKYFEQITQGLEEAIAIERGELAGKKTIYRIEPVKNYDAASIRALRHKANMTQVIFAKYLGVSNKTVEAWEKGTNRPTGSARRLLSVLEENKVSELPFVKVQTVSES